MHVGFPSAEHGQTTRGAGVARAVVARPRHTCAASDGEEPYRSGCEEALEE
jgi:hypothetical protein